MDIFIIIFKDGKVMTQYGYTPMLRRLTEEGKVKDIINISKPMEPRILKEGSWIKLHDVG